MSEREYMEQKHLIYYKEIIENLRKEIKDLIEENDNLRARVKDLEEINQSHQELVGEILMNREFKDEKIKR